VFALLRALIMLPARALRGRGARST
jgi:hypothetical protein